MSQPATWGGARAVDAPVTPEVVAERLADSVDALLSAHSGASRPSYAVAGTAWYDTGTTTWYLYDGTTDWPIELRAGAATVLGTVAGIDTITAELTPTLAAYAELTTVILVTAGDNTGAVTLNIDGVGAKDVVKAGGTALAAADLASGAAYQLWYDASNDRFQVIGL